MLKPLLATVYPLSRQSIRSFTTTAVKMGVTVTDARGGDGKTFPKPGDQVTIHYAGTLVGGERHGSEFDSSYRRDAPFVCKIGVGQVIKGWDEGVTQLSLGQKATLICTPDYAYGARGFPPLIPANSTLKFEGQQY
nr:FK506-binding protein 1 [Cryptococcus depauperatus CBS 7855]